jgi:hypothetical protein
MKTTRLVYFERFVVLTARISQKNLELNYEGYLIEVLGISESYLQGQVRRCDWTLWNQRVWYLRDIYSRSSSTQRIQFGLFILNCRRHSSLFKVGIHTILSGTYPLLGNDSVYAFQRTHNNRNCVVCGPCYNSLVGNTTILTTGATFSVIRAATVVMRRAITRPTIFFN